MAITALTGSWDDFSAADGVDVFNETIGDGATDLVPFPLSFNSGLDSKYRAPFFCVASEFNGTVSRTTAAYSACGATLISPQHVVMAHHCKPTGVYFKQTNGTEVYRTIAANTQVNTDLSVGRLSAVISTIDPVGVLMNPGVMVGRYAGMLEAGRFITQFQFTEIGDFFSCVASTATGGDSGHPVFAINGTTPVLIGIVNGVGNEDIGHVMAANIDAINAVLDDYGESLVQYSAPVATGLMTAFSAACSPSVPITNPPTWL